MPPRRLKLGIKKANQKSSDWLLAERQGFEPWVPERVQRFSRPSRSTTPASFQYRNVVCAFPGAKVGIIFGLTKFLTTFFVPERLQRWLWRF